jgi:predicted transcriptional regulator
MEFFRIYTWMFPKVQSNNNDVILYAFIYSFHEKGLKAQFSLSELASLLNVTKRTIQNGIKKLKEKNLIRVESVIEKDGGNGMNIYSIV